jgi:hypothetical protein
MKYYRRDSMHSTLLQGLTDVQCHILLRNRVFSEIFVIIFRLNSGYRLASCDSRVTHCELKSFLLLGRRRKALRTSRRYRREQSYAFFRVQAGFRLTDIHNETTNRYARRTFVRLNTADICIDLSPRCCTAALRYSPV